MAPRMASNEETIAQDENMRLSELRFRAQRGDTAAAADLKAGLIERKALCFLQSTSKVLVCIHHFPLGLCF